jgi:uncharacterized membrane protein
MTGSDPQSTPPQPTPPQRAGRALRLALIASLALNLLFLGLIAGGAMTSAQRHAGSAFAPDLRALWRALPDDDRQALRERFGDDAGGAPRLDRDERRARAAGQEAELLTLLRAEAFDAEAFASLLDARREAMATRSAAAQALLVEWLSEMSAAERAALAERYEERRGGRFRPR